MPTIQEPVAATASPDRIPALLKAAFAANRERPEADVRSSLNLQLRAEIRLLLPKVQAQMNNLTPRSRAWYARGKAIDLAREELAKGISPSPLAACLSLAELARRLHALDEFAGGES